MTVKLRPVYNNMEVSLRRSAAAQLASETGGPNGIPSGAKDRREFRDICSSTVELENHFLGIYRPFLLSELQALKVLEYDTDADLIRLAREGAAHAKLAHPNITRVYDVNVTEVSGDRFLYIASEYMSMGNLGSYLNLVSRLKMNEWRTLARDILGALMCAHKQESPVLHRDITLANILVGGTSSHLIFKLGDFGVSAELRDGRRVASAAGTLLFLAPECGFGPYLVESDVYSAAVVLYKD